MNGCGSTFLKPDRTRFPQHRAWQEQKDSICALLRHHAPLNPANQWNKMTKQPGDPDAQPVNGWHPTSFDASSVIWLPLFECETGRWNQVGGG